MSEKTNWFAITKTGYAVLYYNSAGTDWSHQIDIASINNLEKYHRMAAEMFSRIYKEYSVNRDHFMCWYL